jgi:hypothetical protein
MDKGHTRSAWSPHSYENLYFLQERYESVVLSRHMVDQIRSIPTLIHKAKKVYEWLRGSPWTPSISRRDTRRWNQRQEMRRLSVLPCAEVTVSAQRVGLFRVMFCESGARVFRHILS